jgi:hypothetical protein
LPKEKWKHFDVKHLKKKILGKIFFVVNFFRKSFLGENILLNFYGEDGIPENACFNLI